MKLSETQNLFKKMTLIPGSDEGLSLKPPRNLSMRNAFEIYHQKYIGRLTEALHDTFETVNWSLGNELFRKICKNFIETEPSVSYNLADYGETFPEFLKVSSHAKGIPFLYDLARFEWMFKNLYHRPSPDPLPVEQIQDFMRASDYSLKFVDAMEVFDSPYAVSEIWARRKEPSYMFEDIPWEQPEHLLLYKKDHRIHIMPIGPIESRVIRALQEGQSVSATLGLFSNELNSEKIKQIFHLMMRAGIIEDVLIAEP